MTATETDAFAALRDRLTGSVVTRSSGYWDVFSAAWVVDGGERRPSAVVHAATAQDVAETLAFAAEHGLRVTPQTAGRPGPPQAQLAGMILLRTCAVPGIALELVG